LIDAVVQVTMLSSHFVLPADCAETHESSV